MDSGCVYQQKTVVHELTQAIQMAKQLRVNLDSAEAREFLIQKILSSYENALSVLKSGDFAGQGPTTAMPVPSLPESLISIGSGKFEFNQLVFNQQDQNVVSKKRKELTTWEDEAEISNKRKQIFTCNHGAQSTAPPPPPSPEKYELKPTHHYQPSPPNSGETLSNLRANLSVNTSAGTAPSLFSFPSFGSMGDYQKLPFPNYLHDDLLQVQSPSFISPDTSESNYITDWGSSPSLDFSNDPADVDLEFKFDNFLF